MNALDAFKGRANLVSRTGERWRTPDHSPATTLGDRITTAARAFLDIQFGSILRDLAKVLPEIEGTVVDVGCGAQPFRRLFGSSVHYIGIDTLDAAAKFGQRHPDTIYYTGKNLPVEDNFSDFILCTETLEHVIEPLPFLNELRRCLKPGGKLLITVPFAARWHFVPQDYWRFTPTGLGHLVHEAGFSDVAVYARGNQLTVACYKLMACILPLILSQRKNPVARLAEHLLGLLLSPVLLACAVVANISLAVAGTGVDALGYTLFAVKPRS